jgi:hypothetical protein
MGGSMGLLGLGMCPFLTFETHATTVIGLD